MNHDKLAIYGGVPAVTTRYRERWRNIHLKDLLPIVAYAMRGVNTVGDGGGIVGRFEKRFANMCQTAYALATNSGTAALHSAFFAVGVKPGDEVVVPAYTWFASAAPIMHCGATPVFCDIDPRTLTADPDDVEKRITPQTRAICVVHIWGNPAAMDRFVDIAKRHQVALIEDCSHAHGASYQGRPVGSWGDIGCYSLQGSKAVSGGEAGIAVTSDPVLFDRMLALGHNLRTLKGQQADTFQIDNVSLGLKYRPHLYAIALANGSLSRLSQLNQLRAGNYQLLGESLKDCPAVQPVACYPDAVRGGYLEFVLVYDPAHAGGLNVGAFAKAAAAEGVPIQVDRYTRQGANARLLHESPIFCQVDYSKLGGYLAGPSGSKPPAARAGQLPVSQELSNRLLSMSPLTKVSERFVRECAGALKKVAACAGRMKDFRSGDH